MGFGAFATLAEFFTQLVWLGGSGGQCFPEEPPVVSGAKETPGLEGAHGGAELA